MTTVEQWGEEVRLPDSSLNKQFCLQQQIPFCVFIDIYTYTPWFCFTTQIHIIHWFFKETPLCSLRKMRSVLCLDLFQAFDRQKKCLLRPSIGRLFASLLNKLYSVLYWTCNHTTRSDECSIYIFSTFASHMSLLLTTSVRRTYAKYSYIYIYIYV